jgi:hypothetical protein
MSWDWRDHSHREMLGRWARKISTRWYLRVWRKYADEILVVSVYLLRCITEKRENQNYSCLSR